MKKYVCLIFGLFATLNSVQAESHADFTITSFSTNRAFSSVSDGQPMLSTGRERVSTRVSGEKESDCTPYGRKSLSIADANVSYSQSDSNSVITELSTNAFAAGGHYRSCFTCGPTNQCVIIEGHDTNAKAEASVTSVTKIEFGNDLDRNSYNLSISSSGASAGLGVQLKLPSGEKLDVDLGKNFSRKLDVAGGEVFFIETSADVKVANDGGCCEAALNVSNQIKIALTPAPIIASSEDDLPFILNAAPVTDDEYSAVVAILLDGKMHCSGTIVGSRTIITAAHCIKDFEPAIVDGRMSVFIGNSIFQNGETLAIVDAVYPRGEDGFKYVGKETGYSNDIGLFYSAGPLPGVPMRLHIDDPTWANIKSDYHRELTFVGFGLKTMVHGKGSGAGVKRAAVWQYKNIDDHRFYFSGQSSNTCMGDSGGPALIQSKTSGDIILVGITSAGKGDCTTGIEVRVDAYNNWFAPRIQ